MKDLSEYKTMDDVVFDLVREGVVMRPSAHVIEKRKQRVEIYRTKILDYVTERSSTTNVEGWRMQRAIRPDTHFEDYQAALQSLINEGTITEEKQITGRRGRPAVYYRLFEN